jgi:hypothetical protein
MFWPDSPPPPRGAEFHVIQQGVGTTCSRSDETIRFLRQFVEVLKSEGLTADALPHAGRIPVRICR